jgi:hypothetical protein
MGQVTSYCISKREDCCYASTNEELFGRRYLGENTDQKFLTYNDIVQDADHYVKKSKNKKRKHKRRK